MKLSYYTHTFVFNDACGRIITTSLVSIIFAGLLIFVGLYWLGFWWMLISLIVAFTTTLILVWLGY